MVDFISIIYIKNLNTEIKKSLMVNFLYILYYNKNYDKNCDFKIKSMEFFLLNKIILITYSLSKV